MHEGDAGMSGRDVSPKTKVSVVIRCFNEEAHIGRLLEGIGQQSLEDVQVIVADSGSTDGTVAVALGKGVEVLSIRPDDFSFGHSLNVGCAAANGEYIVVVSAHAYPVYHDWLERIIAPFQDADVALVYGKQRGNETTKYSEHQLFKKWFPDEVGSEQRSIFCNNANAAIRRSVWEGIRYDESLTGLEDLAWAKAAKAKGYRIVYEPLAEIIHVHNESLIRLYYRYKREAMALKRILPEERVTFTNFLFLLMGNVLSDMSHAWRERVLGGTWASILGFRLMQFWGTYRGFAVKGGVDPGLKKRFYYPNDRRCAQPPSEDVGRGVGQPIDYSEADGRIGDERTH